MYLTVMDYSTKTITKLVWDVVFEQTTPPAIEECLERCGYHLGEIAYMATEDEPDFGEIEVADLIN